MVAALLWIIISLATGGTILFALIGGILVGIVAFLIGFGFRVFFDRRAHSS